MGVPFDDSGPVTDDRPPWQQPRLIVGLSVVAALVLVAGLVVAFTGGNDDRIATVDPPGLPTTSAAAPTTIGRAPATTTTTTTPTTAIATTAATTSTSTTTTTTTVAPEPAVANAGDDRVVSFGETVTLAAIDLGHPDQSVVFRQVGGPDVTGGAERFVGNESVFTAPTDPATLFFEVDVTGLGGDVATDDLRIDVFERADRAIFVDGERGADDGDGSRSRPFRTLGRSFGEAAQRDVDIHLRAIDGFTYSTGDQRLSVGGDTSIYGGYDADWTYDAARPTDLVAFTVSGAGDVRISTVGVAGDMYLAQVGRVAIDHAVFDAATGSGIVIEAISELSIDSSMFLGGDREPRDPPAPPDDLEPPNAGLNGGDANGRTPGLGGDGNDGGLGGEGRRPGQDGIGPGGAGGEIGENGAAGGGGAGGDGGRGGDGGQGTRSVDGIALTGSDGVAGASAGVGRGGGGGGGGGGLILHDGGGGGGGGAGGEGGAGGVGGAGGRGSVGLVLRDIETVVITNSTILGGRAGDGGPGGPGQSGAPGGSGGLGADGTSSIVDTAGRGGAGGGAGAGGEGGAGGGGAGGVSAGLVTERIGSITVSDTVIRAGTGGTGGPGGEGGRIGDQGSSGTGAQPGVGGDGHPSDAQRAEFGVPAGGGASIGWWDDGRTSRTLTNVTIEAGTPGQPGGEGGQVGDVVTTTF